MHFTKTSKSFDALGWCKWLPIFPTKANHKNELKRLKIRKYYKKPQLKEISVPLTLKDGRCKKVKSFQVKHQFSRWF
jgi:hypothetical protein